MCVLGSQQLPSPGDFTDFPTRVFLNQGLRWQKLGALCPQYFFTSHKAFWNSLRHSIKGFFHRSCLFPEAFTKGYDIVHVLLLLSSKIPNSKISAIFSSGTLRFPLDFFPNQPMLCKFWRNTYYCVFSQAFNAHLNLRSNYKEVLGDQLMPFQSRRKRVIAFEIHCHGLQIKMGVL